MRLLTLTHQHFCKRSNKLTQRCCTKAITQGIHPELQAEITFGLENSTDHTSEDFVELTKLFLNHPLEKKAAEQWKLAEQDIRKKRDSHTKIPDITTESLHEAMLHEVDYVYTSWKGQHENALNISSRILTALEGGADLNPYRAFWLHQAAVSAFLTWKYSNNESFKMTAISYLDKASQASSNITWLSKLRSQLSESPEDDGEVFPTQEWFLKINSLLQRWRIIGGNYAKRVSEVKNNIEDIEFNTFEKGLAQLGEMLGANSYQWSDDGAPDGLWIFGTWHAFVFEAKTEENPENGISLDTVRQTLTHEKRVRTDNLIPDFVPCSTVLISPRKTVHKLAISYVEDIAYLSHEDIIKLFSDTALALEKLRSSAPGCTEESLQANAFQFYGERVVAIQNIKNRLLQKQLKDLPLA